MKELSFETEYQLQEFRKIQGEYFDEHGETYFKNNKSAIMEKMFNLINQLEKELAEDKRPIGWQEWSSLEEEGTCNKYKWNDCECKDECKRGLKQ